MAENIGPLLDRVALGDHAAFADVYEASAAKLYGIVLRILKRKDLADEVLQDVYVKIWERARDFNPAKGSAMAWMATIARNRALDEVRRKRPTVAEDHPQYLNTPSEDESALISVLRREDGQRLAECLDELDEDRRKLVVLAYCEGLSRDELAAMFKQPVNTIKTWLRRALQRLKGCLSA